MNDISEPDITAPPQPFEIPTELAASFNTVPQAQGFVGHGTRGDLGENWRVAFRDADGLPLNMQSFEQIDFGAISYKEIFQNVKTIVATPLFSAALERLLGVDARIVDLPIDAAADATVALLQAIYSWEPRAQALDISFDADVLNGHLLVLLQLNIRNNIYGTDTPYDRNNIFVTAPEPHIAPPLPASTYAFSGPSSGYIGVKSEPFTVRLLEGTVTQPITVTPNDGSGDIVSGTFTPASVRLSADKPVATFAYTPAVSGKKIISVTNDGGLREPPALSFEVSQAPGTYTFSGPATGVHGVPSQPFTVSLPAGTAPDAIDPVITVTPTDAPPGTAPTPGAFTPSSVDLSVNVRSATFTYTPPTAGDKIISVTNNGGLINPAALKFTAT